jgi:hypothetical protein
MAGLEPLAISYGVDVSSQPDTGSSTFGPDDKSVRKS